MDDTTNAALRRRPREYESEREDEAERKYCDKALDERLQHFPLNLNRGE